MPTTDLRRRRGPKPDRRRALELLASCRDGCTEAIMFAHGFSIDMTVGLVNAGLATATAERVVAGRRAIEVARVRITEGGDSKNSRIVESHKHNARARVASADVLMEKQP
jgi:hypothetical protein